MRLLRDQANNGTAILMVTHDPMHSNTQIGCIAWTPECCP